MIRSLVVLCLVLVSCQDYNIFGRKDDPKTPPDSGPSWDSEAPPEDSEPPIDTEPPAEEVCNGEDDDGDGLVDEGFDDSDGDGIADCVDEDCDVDEHPGGEVEVLEACTGTVVEVVKDPWNVGIEWQWASPGQGVLVMPAVGNLTDDNGDGVVDENDDPDIVFPDWTSRVLVALHGDGSGVIFELSDISGVGGVTIADVDVDGEPEVIALTTDSEVVAVDGAGTIEWRSEAFSLSNYPQPAVVDLDADGDVEVVYDQAVVAGADGSTHFTLSGVATSYRAPVLADIDADGTQEIVLGERVFSHTGALEVDTGCTYPSAFAAVADIDGDAVGELILVTGSFAILYESDGTMIRAMNLPGSNPGPPSVADYDGDGEVELAVPASSAISVWEFSGSQLWSSPVDDYSGMAGCSGYDIDGDGAYELLYADQSMFRIYDGATGAVRYANNSHDSATLWEYPVTADVDGDGSAEIVIASNGVNWQGITVFGHTGSGWQASGPTWGTHDFSLSNLEPDGTVPSPAPLPGSGHNVFRARPIVDQPALADLAVFIEDLCVASCEHGPAKLSFAVSNQGQQSVPAGASVALYALDGGAEVLIDTAELDEIPAGQVVAAGVLELHPDEWGEDGLLLRVDDDGTGVGAVRECDESNNEYEYGDRPCG